MNKRFSSIRLKEKVLLMVLLKELKVANLEKIMKDFTHIQMPPKKQKERMLLAFNEYNAK